MDNSKYQEQTIAAISTGNAPGGIGIVRISGVGALEVAGNVFRARSGKALETVPGYTVHLGTAVTREGEPIDEVLATVFRSPKSYTGEDVVELSCHGGLVVVNRLLEEVLGGDCRLALPGEFTKRAFLNGKLDLAQAEGVMQLISAGSKKAAGAANASTAGVLSQRLEGMRSTLKEVAAHLTAWADFPEEDVPEVEEAALKNRLEEVLKELHGLLEGYDRGQLFQQGVPTVIAGRPNAGKSTLMNLLAGCQRSIVTQYEGTTRDVVEETVLVAGIPLRLADTAGLRDTADPVERMGVEAARKRVEQAQLVLAVFDSSRPLGEEDLTLLEQLRGEKAIAVVNKSDMESQIELDVIREFLPRTVVLSAAQGTGLEALSQAVEAVLGTGGFDPAQGILTTQRQKEIVDRGRKSLEEALGALAMGLTLDAVTINVEEALKALYEMTGINVSEEVVNEVFSTFCVGK